MKDTPLPNYSELSDQLNDSNMKLHPSQLHGLICGVVCGEPDKKPNLTKLIHEDGEKKSNFSQVLDNLYKVSLRQLKDFLFEFQLLLPADSVTLPNRAEALTLWCQGYLTGLEAVDIPIEGREPSDITEAINDLIEIAKMDYEEVVANDEDEEAYIQLVEYVRMAAILIYQECGRQSERKEPIKNTSHFH